MSRSHSITSAVDNKHLTTGADEDFESQIQTFAELSASLFKLRYQRCSSAETARIVARASDFVLRGLNKSLCDRIRSAPATRYEIAKHLAGLVLSFPNARPPSPELYSRALAEEVSSLRPTLWALEFACRKLRRELDFPPTVAEVVEAVRGVEDLLKGCLKRLLTLEADIAFARQHMEEELAFEARYQNNRSCYVTARRGGLNNVD
jgi:hypothetical protein